MFLLRENVKSGEPDFVTEGLSDFWRSGLELRVLHGKYRFEYRTYMIGSVPLSNHNFIWKEAENFYL